MKLLKVVLVLFAASLLCVSCSKSEDPGAVSYTVTFDTDGGVPVPDPVTVEKGKTVNEPEVIPAKEGFTFSGWFTESGLKFNFKSTPVTKDITLVAHWWAGPKQYVLINDYSWKYNESSIAATFGTPTGKDVCAGASVLMFMFERAEAEFDDIIRQHIANAEQYDCPVLFNFDPITFWDTATDIWNWFDPSKPDYNPENRENVEWYDWGSEHAVKIGWLNWGMQCRLAPMANLYGPKYQAAVKKRFKRYLTIIDDWYKSLPEEKKYLLVGVKLVGELAVGVNNWYYPNGNDLYDKDIKDDPQGGINMYLKPSRGVQTIGYAALTYSGIKTSGTITGEDIAKLEAKFTDWLCGLTDGFSFPREKIFTHAGGCDNDLDAALNPKSCPSWSFYLADAADASNFSYAMGLLQKSDAPYWAVSEWAIGENSAPANWTSGINSALMIDGCRYVNVCTNVIGNNNGTSPNPKAVEGIKALMK